MRIPTSWHAGGQVAALNQIHAWTVGLRAANLKVSDSSCVDTGGNRINVSAKDPNAS